MEAVPKLGDAGVEDVFTIVDDFDSDSRPSPRGSALVTGSCVPLTTFSAGSELAVAAAVAAACAAAAAAPNVFVRIIGEYDSFGVLMPDVAWLIWLEAVLAVVARPFAAWAYENTGGEGVACAGALDSVELILGDGSGAGGANLSMVAFQGGVFARPLLQQELSGRSEITQKREWVSGEALSTSPHVEPAR